MEFPGIYGHEIIKERLVRAYQQNHIPSAYLFLGENGIGKSSLVKEFAQLLNCDSNTICHTCPNCRLFDSGAHPDFHVIERNGQFIRIGQIQELISQLNLKPAYASKRVVLIKAADCLNQEAANSFLKILEEPPLDTLIVLTTADENLLLETILSRCQKIPFSPLQQPILERIFDEKFKLKEVEKKFILNYSGGKIRKDFIAKAATLYTMRRQVLDMLCTLSIDKMVDHINSLEQWVKKDLQAYFLEFCAIWLKDFLYIKSGRNGYLTNSDLISDIELSQIPGTTEQLIWAFDLTIETELSVLAFAGKILALESLLIQLKQVFEGVTVV